MNNEKVNKAVVEDFNKISTLMISLEAVVSTEVEVDKEVIITEVIHSAATSNNITKTYLKIQMLRNLICSLSSSSIEERKFGLFCTTM